MIAAPALVPASAPRFAGWLAPLNEPPVPRAPRSGELRELHEGLLAAQPYIAPRYFYDDRGSALFEAITRTDDYYVTRTEARLMAQHLTEMAEAVQDCLGHVQAVIEPGAGSCVKAQALCAVMRPRRYVGLDIAADFMAQGAQRLREQVPGLLVQTAGVDLREPLRVPQGVPRRGRLVFYPGSSIGNFSPTQASAFLSELRELIGDDGALLIGVDLIKPESTLLRAYDDSQGITAEFNRNVLLHVNRLLQSDFDPELWNHVAVWNAAHARIEMHLEAACDQRVCWGDEARDFRRGDRVLTEHSHKYTVSGFGRLLARAGLSIHRSWVDAEQPYAVLLAVPA